MNQIATAGVEHQRGPHIAARRKIERARKDTRDRDVFAIEGDRLADDGTIGAKPIAPQALAEHNGPAASGLMFFRQKRPAGQRLHTQQSEELNGDLGRSDSNRVAAAEQCRLPVSIRGQVFEDMVLFDPFLEVGIEHRFKSVGSTLVLVNGVNHQQPVGGREWQRPEQHSVDNAEHGRVRPDAERQREHGYGGEAGVLQQLAEGVFQIVHKQLMKFESVKFELSPCLSEFTNSLIH